MITRDEVLMGRDKQYPADYTKEVSDNIDKLLIALNKLRKAYGKPMTVSSGFRPPSINAATAGAAKRSNHMLGLACDFKDADGELDKWLMANLKLLEEIGLWLEHPDATKGWAHVQIVPPRSGNRVFRP